MQFVCPPGYNCNWSMNPAQDNTVPVIAFFAIIATTIVGVALAMALWERWHKS